MPRDIILPSLNIIAPSHAEEYQKILVMGWEHIFVICTFHYIYRETSSVFSKSYDVKNGSRGTE
jgi:hypothetical protein